METLSYKGYIGEYELHGDGETAYYAGTIPSVKHKALVVFEGETMDELISDFHAAVEDCIANNYFPQAKSHRVTIPAPLYAQLKARAIQNGQSLSSFVSHALASALL